MLRTHVSQENLSQVRMWEINSIAVAMQPKNVIWTKWKTEIGHLETMLTIFTPSNHSQDQ